MKTRHPAGKSLVELLVVMALMSIMLGLCATSLATLFRLRNQLSRDREQGAALSRLASRLRQDAHEAVSASSVGNALRGVPGTDVNGLTLQLPDNRTIDYTFSAPHILREVRQNSTLLHRDRFSLPTSAAATFRRDSSQPEKLLRLEIRPVEVRTRRTEAPRTATIQAALGLNQSITRPWNQ